MTYYVYSIICLLMSIGLITGMVFYSKTLEYSDAPTKDECNSKHPYDLKNKTCGLFDNGTCFKSIPQPDDMSCVKDGSMVGLLMLFGSGVFFIAFIVFLVMGLRHKSTSNFSYHSSDSSSY
jgi:disulfide bond formation protein DsbB